MELEKFTYRDLTKTKNRNEMLCNGLSSLGTQAGGFGIFKEQARVLTVGGAAKMLMELQDYCDNYIGMDLDCLLEECPAIKALLK